MKAGGGMKRREAQRRAAKSRRQTGIRKGRKTSIARVSTADLQAQLDLRTRERDAALEQQAATADVLKVISRSSVDLETVWIRWWRRPRDSAAPITRVFRRRGDMLHLVASWGLPSEAIDFLLAHPLAADRSTLAGRVELERRPQMKRLCRFMCLSLAQRFQPSGKTCHRGYAVVPSMLRRFA
jgi:hypothetical protein